MSKISQPSEQAVNENDRIMENTRDVVTIPGTNKSYKIGYMHNKTIRKISHIMTATNPTNDDKVSCKAAAAIILNGMFKITFLYWFLWRWFYYVKQYDEKQMTPIFEMGKKKVQQESYYLNTILLIGMKDTIMTMKKKEVELFLQEQRGGQPTA